MKQTTALVQAQLLLLQFVHVLQVVCGGSADQPTIYQAVSDILAHQFSGNLNSAAWSKLNMVAETCEGLLPALFDLDDSWARGYSAVFCETCPAMSDFRLPGIQGCPNCPQCPSFFGTLRQAYDQSMLPADFAPPAHQKLQAAHPPQVQQAALPPQVQQAAQPSEDPASPHVPGQADAPLLALTAGNVSYDTYSAQQESAGSPLCALPAIVSADSRLTQQLPDFGPVPTDSLSDSMRMSDLDLPFFEDADTVDFPSSTSDQPAKPLATRLGTFGDHYLSDADSGCHSGAGNFNHSAAAGSTDMCVGPQQLHATSGPVAPFVYPAEILGPVVSLTQQSLASGVDSLGLSCHQPTSSMLGNTLLGTSLLGNSMPCDNWATSSSFSFTMQVQLHIRHVSTDHATDHAMYRSWLAVMTSSEC